MTALLLVLVTLALAVAAALFFMDDPGYVLITLKPWSVEVSLALFIVLLAAGFLVLYFAIRTLVRTWNSPRNLRQARQRRREGKAHQLRAKGMLELIEGDWSRAEKHLLSYLPYADNQVLNFIGAAHAAHSQGNFEARDSYLQKARKAAPDRGLEIGVTQALLQYRAGEYEPALKTLEPLRRNNPKNAKILGLTVKTCEELRDWQKLMEFLPAARKHGALPEPELDRLQKLAAVNVLQHAEPERLDQAWKTLPKSEQSDSDLLAAYADRQIQMGRMDEAENLLRKAVNRSWEPDWVRLYGRVVSSDLSSQLKTAEQWAAKHPDDPELMLALARICLNHELWGKARSYLEACIGAGGTVEAYEELGRLLEQLDDPEKALAYYRDGLKKASAPGGEGAARQLEHVRRYEEFE
ncbi:MAG: heme biosynthesis HemY N-terminal domain-containing protein [Gammaproteobacteria bacterium]|nr:heme biosynthesis HemY N-terminal domain-containing protein [Gammaproteobacteria bacterium]